MPTPQLLERLVFKTTDLVREHPPVWHDRNKRVVFEVACPPGAQHGGKIRYPRWHGAGLPQKLPWPSDWSFVEPRSGFFD